jgi:hypothetical protein
MECDNTTTVGIINDTIRQRRSKAMDMRFYWIKDRQQQGQFRLYWASGSTNRGDYFTKHHSPAHHRIMRPHYMHTPTAQELKQKQLGRGKQKYTIASLIGEIRGLLQGLGKGVLILPQDPGYQDPGSSESDTQTSGGPGSKRSRSGRHSFPLIN